MVIVIVQNIESHTIDVEKSLLSILFVINLIRLVNFIGFSITRMTAHVQF